jgi:hypothetical protein
MYLVWELLELSNLSTAVFCSDRRNLCLDGGTELSQIEYAGQGEDATEKRGDFTPCARLSTFKPQDKL